jgi:hypothetical protein
MTRAKNSLATLCGIGLRRMARPVDLDEGAAAALAPPYWLSRRWAGHPMYRWCAVLLLGCALTLDVASMRRLTTTYDEPSHFRYGQHILDLESARFDDSKMPVSALNALPARVATALGLVAVDDIRRQIKVGRHVTVLFSVLIGYFIFRWARDLYGPAGGLLSLALYTFDPNVLAHSQLVTTDAYAMGTITLSLYSFWRFLRLGGWGRASVSALMLGLSQLSKYTAVFLFPLLLLIVLGWYGSEIWTLTRQRRSSELGRRLIGFARSALFFLMVSLGVINAGFLFNGTFTPFGNYQFRSAGFRSAQSSLAGFASVPLPVPYPYLEGLDWVLHRERTGLGRGNTYLLGELRGPDEGFTGYYFYACLFKLPIATQLLVLAAALSLVRRRFASFRDEWVLVCPIVVFTIYFNFFYRAQMGIRFFLVVLSLLFVFCGRLLRNAGSLARPAKAALAGALLFLVVSVLSYYPHFLSYFNELVWDRTQAYKILADSNLDWGQNYWYLNEYLRAHPDVIVEATGPTAGTIVVDVNSLIGIMHPERWRWLRENFQPVAHIAYSFLVFRVSPDDLARIDQRVR